MERAARASCASCSTSSPTRSAASRCWRSDPSASARARPSAASCERVNGPIYAEIAERRGAADLAERDDIMSLLLQATHEDGSPMSDAELRDELVTLLVAGHETTANALSWAVERLCRHPEQARASRRGGRGGRDGRLPEGGRPGDAAAAPGDLDRPAPAARSRWRSVDDVAGRRLDRALDPPGPPRADIYPEPDTRSDPSGSSRPSARPAPTPGSRSAAACAAAWAPPSPSSRWRSCCASWSCGARSAPRGPPPSAVYRRAITETPRHDAEVVLSS